MSRNNTSPDTLYKPALYAKFSKRSDLPIVVTLLRYCSMEEKEFRFKPTFSACLGLELKGNQIFMGIPERLWEMFSSIDWKHFKIKGNRIYLYYHVEQVTKKRVQSSIKQFNKAQVEIFELCFSFVFTQAQIDADLTASLILHLWQMDEGRVGNPKDGITLSSMLS